MLTSVRQKPGSSIEMSKLEAVPCIQEGVDVLEKEQTSVLEEEYEHIVPVADKSLQGLASSLVHSRRAKSEKRRHSSGVFPPDTLNDPSIFQHLGVLPASNKVYRNFVVMSLFCSTIPATALACLALATSQLGSTTGALQTCLLYASYTCTSLTGLSTLSIQRYGSKRTLVVGMICYMAYVISFATAALLLSSKDYDSSTDSARSLRVVEIVTATGAFVGGIGAGLLWTSQGVYFSEVSEEYCRCLSTAPEAVSVDSGDIDDLSNGGPDDQTPLPLEHYSYSRESGDGPVRVVRSAADTPNPLSHSITAVRSNLAGIFAFILLAEETLLDVASTVAVRQCQFDWIAVFAIYTLLGISATVGMHLFVHDYHHRTKPTLPSTRLFGQDKTGTIAMSSERFGSGPADDIEAPAAMIVGPSSTDPASPGCYKAAATFRLLLNDSKMKYMIGFNAAFGVAGAFLNSFVSGEVVPVALDDDKSSFVCLLVALHGTVAALASLCFGSPFMASHVGNGPILVLGAVCFGAVALPFLLQPQFDQWNWTMLIVIYSFQGIGRATFEGTLKAIFADFFSYEKEGAFANIILQNGVSSSVAYVLSFSLTCKAATRQDENTNPYCVKYRDGSHHDVFSFALVVVGTSVVAVLGYWRASVLHADASLRAGLRLPRRLSMSTYSPTSPSSLNPLRVAVASCLAERSRSDYEAVGSVGTPDELSLEVAERM
jgi:MFS family permease